MTLCLSVALSACGASTVVDKQGAPSAAVTELTLGTSDPQDAQLAFFVDAVATASDHRLRIRVDATTWFSETPGGEAKLTGDVRAGTVPLGYVASRDLATDGSPAFQALHAPFLLGTTAEAVALAADPVAKDVLAGLDDRGVHGLALIPLESRRLLTTKPVLALDDLTGARIRINDSAQSAKLFSALSAIPVQGYLAAKTKAELAAGRLDGVESSPLYVVPNGYFTSTPYLTSFGLFPKFDALVVNQKAWTTLSDADRKALETAAAQTLAHAVTDTPKREETALSQLCARGVVVVRPTDQALSTLKAAAAQAAPDDTSASGWVARLRDALAKAGAATPAAPTAGSGCPVATTAAQAQELRGARTSSSATASAGPSARATASTAVAAFPYGTYETKVTKEQWAAANSTGSNAPFDVTFTSTLNPDGTFSQTQVPNPPDQGPYQGTYTVTGDRIVFDYHPVYDATERYVETVTWSYFKGELHFVSVDVVDSGSRVVYEQPWRKTA